MADIFSTENARNLFRNKFVFMLGDSNMRAMYKDLVQLLNKNSLITQTDLRRRGEESFLGDKRIVFSGLIKGRNYAEGREYLKNDVHVEYHFVTRCYTEAIEEFLRRIKIGIMRPPDVFIMNSCLWDITRWGSNGVDAYKENMKKLMSLVSDCLTEKTLFIWTTTLPVSAQIKGGVLIKQIDFLQNLLRFEVMEANLFCRHLVVSHGFDVLDVHYYLRMQIHRRFRDGVHYGPLPLRFISNLLLTHVALSWDVPLPGNSHGIALDRIIRCAVLQPSSKSNEVKLPKLPDCLKLNDHSHKNDEPVSRNTYQTHNNNNYTSNNKNNNHNYNGHVYNYNNTVTNSYNNNGNFGGNYKRRKTQRELGKKPQPKNDWETQRHNAPWNANRGDSWVSSVWQSTAFSDNRNQPFWRDTTGRGFEENAFKSNRDYEHYYPRDGSQSNEESSYGTNYETYYPINSNRVGGPVRNKFNNYNKRSGPY